MKIMVLKFVFWYVLIGVIYAFSNAVMVICIANGIPKEFINENPKRKDICREFVENTAFFQISAILYWAFLWPFLTISHVFKEIRRSL